MSNFTIEFLPHYASGIKRNATFSLYEAKWNNYGRWGIFELQINIPWTLSRIAVRYSFLSMRLQSTHRLSERRSIRSSQMRVLRPLPSINGCSTFISTYLSAISSMLVSGIRSIVGMMVGKCRQLANVKPPFDIFLFLICPANSYNPPKR